MISVDVDPQFLSLTPRFRELSRLEYYLDGTQYDHCPGLAEWHDDSRPMRERKPCIVYPLPKAAVQQAVRFALGEGKFPKLRVESSDADDELSPELALDKDQAQSLERAIVDLVSSSLLASSLRTALTHALSARTGVLALSIRNGRFRFEHPRAKDCLPVFRDNDPCGDVLGMIWAYQYDCTEADEAGRPVCKRMFFRRDYTETTIVEYEPAEVVIGQRIDWKVAAVVEHGLGECPVIWVPNLASAGGTGIDGVSIYDGLLDEFDALNRALSQRHYGLEILGTPQPYETGVADGDGPAQVGRTAAPVARDARAPSAGYSSLESRQATQAARKTGARHVWSYKGEGVELGLLETTGKAFEVASAHVKDIKERLLESMNVILTDPSGVAGKGDMSAKALALMFAPMLALVDEIREWWWEHCLRRAVEMMLRIISRIGTRGLLVRSGKDLDAILKRRSVTLEDGTTTWVAPRISPLWGAYFAPSAEETKTEVQTAALAKDKGLVSPKSATQFIAGRFGIEDVDNERELIESDAPDLASAQPSQLGAQQEPQQTERGPDSDVVDESKDEEKQ